MIFLIFGRNIRRYENERGVFVPDLVFFTAMICESIKIPVSSKIKFNVLITNKVF